MRLLIAISRRYPSLPAAAPILAGLDDHTTAILGDNPGNEQRLILALFTHNSNLQQIVYHADWRQHHSAARTIRDRHMLSDCDQVLAFTSGFEHDSDADAYFQDLIHQAYRESVPTQIYDPHLNLLPAQPSLYDLSASY